MPSITTATEDQITQLRRHAVNDVTREIMRDGIKLTWEQAHELGDEVIDWMRSRLGLGSRTTDDGITFTPSPESLYGGHGRYYLRIKTAPHQQWTVPAGWSWDALTEAKAGARKADEQWMAVELIDRTTGKKISFPRGS